MISEEQQTELRKRFNPDGSTLRAMQLKMVEMLEYFDSICKQHNIKYWLSSGTLLGAVRHGGFIPWDDDLDVEMFEEDYHKICEVFKNIQSDDYALQTHETDPDFYYPCAKLRDLHSHIEEIYRFDLRYKYRGIFIDIFCLEPSSSGVVLKLTGGLQNKVLYNLTKIENRALRNMLVKPLNWVLSSAVYPVLSFLSRKCSDGKTYRHRMGMNFMKARYLDDLLPLTTVTFEGHEFPAPTNTDNYLRKIYGDYMRLPDIDKIEVHAVKVDFFKSEKA
ncbi:MAG: LicD family protein [Muribaculaceae bacterium]|nr:LicD family protein [Muribaculaceae bacterium]